MASKDPSFNRNIIPSWRTYAETAKAGELEFSKTKDTPIQFGRFKDYVIEWQHHRCVSTASDLVNAGLVSGNINIPEVVESASYIKSHEEESPTLVLEVASSILSTPSSSIDNDAPRGFDKKVAQLLGRFDQQQAAVKARIGLLRKQIQSFCYNPIAYCEVARCFMDLGMPEKAEHNIRIALHLAPNHRYVTRCAARFYLHQLQPDVAKHILIRNGWVKYDPWVMASEIAVESVMGRSSQYLKTGRQLVLSDSISPFSASELSLAICKEDMKADKRSDSRLMFARGMVKPNNNSLAQAEAIVRFNPSYEVDYSRYSYLNDRFEADTRLLYNMEDFHGAYEASLNWLYSFRFSREPISFAFDIASTFLKRYEEALSILRIGLESNPKDAGLLNNLAYAYGLTNRLAEAEEVLNDLDIEGVLSQNPSNGICLLATSGLLRYRQGFYEEARFLYQKAIEYAKKDNNKYLADKARLNMIREEVHNVKDYDKTILDEISHLDTGSKAETEQMRKDILKEAALKQ